MIRKGDVIEILPDHRDPGDEQYTWVAISDQDKGRIDITAIDHPMTIRPTYVLRVDQVQLLRSAASPPQG